MPSVFDVTNREHTKFTEESGAKNIVIYDSSGNEISVVTRGNKKVISIEVVDASGNQITSFGVDDKYPAGTGKDYSLTLTNADTAYQCPESGNVPSGKYVMVLYNGSDTDIYWGFQNTNANGVLLPPDGRVSLNLGASQQVYCYCGTAGKVLTYILKEIE